MKKFKVILFLTVLFITNFAFAQLTKPGDGSGGAGGVGINPVGGGAPVGTGVYIMLGFALTYGLLRYAVSIDKEKEVI